MKKITKYTLIAISYLFAMKFFFTIFPLMLAENLFLARIETTLSLTAHFILLLYFLNLRRNILKDREHDFPLKILILALGLKFLSRILILFLTFKVDHYYFGNIFYHTRNFIPLFHSFALYYFFRNFRIHCDSSRFFLLKSTLKMNEIGFALLSLINGIALIDFFTTANLYQLLGEGNSIFKILSYMIVIFVFYASFKFYSSMFNIYNETREI